MRLLTFILGIVGNGTAIFVQLSPMPTFWTIVRRKTTGSFSPQPYLFSLLSGMLWTYYGILSIHNGGIPVITISAISSAFQIMYIALYMWFGSKPQRIKTTWIFFLLCGAFATIVIMSIHFANQIDPLKAIGIVCIVSGILSNAAPLSIMHRVIKTKSVEFMPFSLSLGLFLNGAAWLSYAIVLRDLYLMVPNAIGVSLATTQLALYTFFKRHGSQLVLQQ